MSLPSCCNTENTVAISPTDKAIADRTAGAENR
jgi:hypothetical protein